MAGEVDRHWHLDRKVPLILIFAILCQTVAAFWYGGQLTNRVHNVEQEQEEIDERLDRIDLAAANRGERLARIEEGQRSIKDLLSRIYRKLDSSSP